MNSPPLLRWAKTALTRSRVNVAYTSLTATSGTRSNSLSTLSLLSNYKSGSSDDSGLIRGIPWASTLYANTLIEAPVGDIKSTIFNTVANLTGNGVLVTIDYYQVNNKEEEDSEDISTAGNHVASLMDKASASLSELSIWLISTLKRRKKMMNKHKLRKRRKKLRLKSKK
ncbi:hypothetical protein ACHAWX_002453 [Stephanocyclus meneghinianus]